jgi:hypothetical protein
VAPHLEFVTDAVVAYVLASLQKQRRWGSCVQVYNREVAPPPAAAPPAAALQAPVRHDAQQEGDSSSSDDDDEDEDTVTSEVLHLWHMFA